MNFYSYEEQQKIKDKFLSRLKKFNADIIQKALNLDYELVNINNFYNYYRSVLYSKYIFNKDEITKESFKDQLISLLKITKEGLIDIEDYNYFIEVYGEGIMNEDPSIDEAYEIIEEWHFETQCEDGIISNLYNILLSVNDLAVAYLKKYYDYDISDIAFSSLEENRTSTLWLFDGTLEEDLEDIYHYFIICVKTAIEVNEDK